jgi:hypothetical protein
VHGFARREFNLMLLRRMADYQPDRVARAYAKLGATHREYMAVHNRWTTLVRSRRAPRGLALLTAVLGPPDSELEKPWGDVTTAVCTWRLTDLWPDLRWEAIVGHAGVVLHETLVRAAGSPVPERLDPWAAVVGDVLRRYPDARQIDPEVASRWLVEAGGVRYWFVHGLLQLVESSSTVD